MHRWKDQRRKGIITRTTALIDTPALTPVHLSPREVQVMQLITEGKSSKEIAYLLNLGLQTVRSYRKTLMQKLDVHDTASLLILGLTAGIVRLPEPGRPIQITVTRGRSDIRGRYKSASIARA